MKEVKRYKYVDHNGNQCGIENTDNLQEALRTAIEFQCEVVDTKTPEGNQIVWSVWDGWNKDYSFYVDVGGIFTIDDLWGAACGGDVTILKQYYGNEKCTKNRRYEKFGTEYSLIMGAFRNNQFETVEYLLSVGETITEEERIEVQTEMKRIKCIKILCDCV